MRSFTDRLLGRGERPFTLKFSGGAWDMFASDEDDAEPEDADGDLFGSLEGESTSEPRKKLLPFTLTPARIGLQGGDSQGDEDDARRFRSGDPAALEAVLARHKPFLDQQVRNLLKYRVPAPAVRAGVYNAFVDTLHDWDPSRANLQTAYKNTKGRNLTRDIRGMGQFGRVSRNLGSKVDQVRQVAEELELDLNRAATAEEITRAAGLPLDTVRSVLSQTRGDLLASRNLTSEDEYDLTSATYRALRRARDFYSDGHARIVNHLFGMDGAEHIPSNRDLARKMGVSEPYLSNLKGKFLADVQRELQRSGV